MGKGLARSNMAQNFRNQWRIFDAGNHPELAAALRTGLDVDGEDTFEALHPIHGGGRLVFIDDRASAMRNDAFAVFEVGCEDPVETREIQSRARHQGSQAGNKVQRLQHDMRRPIPKQLFVAVHDSASIIDAEPFGGDGGSGNVAAQLFQPNALVGFADGGGM